MKILLVEDQADSRRQLKRLIERRGHEVTAVATAEEGEAVLAQERFPFLILDWMLPGKSGVQLCREVRAQPNGDESFILLVTARSDAQDLSRALEAGANDYLTKPLDVALLNIRLAVAERQIRDLTERNQARAALQESARTMTDILENTTDGFFSLDHEWKFTFLNPEAEFLLAHSRQQLLGQTLWEKFPDTLGSIFETNYRQVMAKQSPIEFEAGTTDGRCFDVRAYPSGGGVSVFFRDITERKRVEEERLTTSKLESLGTLAGGIAHDLNNILTVISGNIGLAQLEAPREAGNLHAFLAKAGQAAQHAAHLSSQLLTFSKGGAPLKKVVSIAQLLRRAAEFSLHGSNLRAEFDIEKGLSEAEVDSDQIEQVVNALVLNAREAMPAGGVVHIAARNTILDDSPTLRLPPGQFIKVTITDRGRGIPEELTTKIFDPYFTTKPAASGLGLSISYSILKKHGGLLHLESTSPEGTTFGFYLPASAKKARQDDPPNGFKKLRAEHQRVLVMDDEAAIRELTSHLLSTLGYEATTVPDGIEAIRTYERAMLRGEDFQAVILDATIRGGLGGVATIEKLRTIDPGVNAIICSGYSDEAALSEFLAYGFRAALPKPFTRGDLAEALQRSIQPDHAN